MKKTYIIFTICLLFFIAGCDQKEAERVYFDLSSERTILIGDDYDLLEGVIVDSSYSGIIEKSKISATSTIVEGVVGEYKATFSYTKKDGSIEYGYQKIFQIYPNIVGNNLLINGNFDNYVNNYRVSRCGDDYGSIDIKQSQIYKRGIITVLSTTCDEVNRPSVGFSAYNLDFKVEHKLSFRVSGVGVNKLQVILNYFDPDQGELVNGYLYPLEVNKELAIVDINDDKDGMTKYEIVVNSIDIEEIMSPTLQFILLDEEGNKTTGRYFLDNIYIQETTEYDSELW